MEEKKNIPAEGETVTPEAPVAEPPVVDTPAPDLNTGPAAPQEQDGITPAAPGDVVVSFDKIEELMAERRAAARAAVEQSEPPAPEAEAPTKGQTVAAPPEQAEEKAAGDKTKEAAAEEQKKPRRGRPPKEDYRPGNLDRQWNYCGIFPNRSRICRQACNLKRKKNSTV